MSGHYGLCRTPPGVLALHTTSLGAGLTWTHGRVWTKVKSRRYEVKVDVGNIGSDVGRGQ